jgi:dTDP-4-dehydrorhamnose 3,5-epimerase
VKFTETKLKGAFIIDIEPVEDERGFFARSFCQNEFATYGLKTNFVQCNISFNKKKGTLRGMHYQVSPHEETKLVRCTRGAIYDVIVDLRPDSFTYKQWAAVDLTEDNWRMVYLPGGVAHGFQTLHDNTEVFYHMSGFHHPECARGIWWDDPEFGIKWPMKPLVISPIDESYKLFNDQSAI